MLDAWTWSPAPCRCELPAGPKSKNIVTVITHSKHFLHPFSGGFVPRAATFSSFLTLCTRNLCDLISSCTHMSATSLCFSFPIPCLWRMCSVVFGSHCKTQVTHHVCCWQFCFCTALCNDLLLSCLCFHGVSSQKQNACAR